MEIKVEKEEIKKDELQELKDEIEELREELRKRQASAAEVNNRINRGIIGLQRISICQENGFIEESGDHIEADKILLSIINNDEVTEWFEKINKYYS